ncbi:MULTISPECIES: heavy metal sensor histidine kinase [Cupriavidus]|uniref:heavy metal sensor histidine kinase n=1 Tax=Cupriavidus TaxID=106589 RepID=UPI000E178E69|nr:MULTISPECIES: heavy metal sensor histidine kinase [Cupriavidus]MEC3764388.1 heavy metal sensor histidine kinase [Cupriavidus sp. SS-3]SOY92998.1 sensory histidine kinase in two-component regulatory system with CopR, regulation of copper resistance, senses copper ions [Cupriavidus taiwanensis]SOY96788.1 sensory histidine kinase in two-component regulatory system with CopR, regulation of copper resistance, senses copper ions [Cupriavidus taiwanensis]
MTPRLSLTARLTILFSLSSAAVLLGLGVLIWLAIDDHFADEDYAVLADNVRLIEKIAADGPAASLPQRLGPALEHHAGFVAEVRGADGKRLYATRDFDFRPALAAAAQAPAGNDAFAWEQQGQTYRGLRARLAHAGAQSGGQPGALRVLVGMDTALHDHFLHAFRNTLAFYGTLAALASGLLGWWAARRGLSPLRTMASRARAVTAHKLDARMPVETVPVEMADLAANLNAMLERLQRDFARLSEFSSDLAHELRTPITNLMTQTQVVLSQPRDAARYRDVLSSNMEELQRLSRMVSDMLYLAKTEHGITLPSAEPIEVADEVGALFDFYDALAEDKGVRLALRGRGRITGDRLMLRRALSNLLSNALRHTPAGKGIVVEITPGANAVQVVVENEGETIRPELLPALFDRFFRADKSRARPESDGAGLGLGLAITQAIVTAHGGAIGVSSEAGKTRFTLTFPA